MINKIFISQVNTSLGYQLVQTLRQDHLHLNDHSEILGSIKQNQSSSVHQSVNQIYKFNKQRDLLVKNALEADYIILNISDTPSYEIQFILKVLKCYPLQKKMTVIGISNYMTWANTKRSQFVECPMDKDSLFESALNRQNWKQIELECTSYRIRVPHPAFTYNYELQNIILDLKNRNQLLNGHIICTGNLYGGTSQDLLDIFQSSISCQSQVLYGAGSNPLPFLNCQALLSIINDLIYSELNLPFINQPYILLCEDKCPTYKQLLEKINSKTGNAKPFTINNQILIEKNDVKRATAIRLRPSKQVTQYLKTTNMYSIIQNMDTTLNQLDECFQFQYKRFFIPEQLLKTEENKKTMSTISQKFITFDKVQLNRITSQLLEKGQIIVSQTIQEEDPKKKVAKKGQSKQSIRKQLYEIHFQTIIKKILEQRKTSNFVVCLKNQHFQKFNLLSSQSFIEVTKVVQKDRPQSSNAKQQSQKILQFSSDQFNTIFEIKQQKVIQQEKKQLNPQINEAQQKLIAQQLRTTKQINVEQQQGLKIDLLSQYLFDNVVVYAAEAQQKLKILQKKRGSKIEGNQKLKLFVQELKKIRKRQSQYEIVLQ